MTPLPKFLRTVTLTIAFCLLSAAAIRADEVAFIPPNDPIGAVFTTNLNDLYSGGRGIVINMSGNTTINSIGFRQNLANIVVNWSVAQVLTATGQVTTGQTILRSGSANVNTGGVLTFVDFGFADLNLIAGLNYHLQFSFNGNSAQNFFYNNGNVPWTQGSFTMLDGTAVGNTSNFVVPAIRLNTVNVNEVPEPVTILLFGTGLAGLVARRRRHQQAK